MKNLMKVLFLLLMPFTLSAQLSVLKSGQSRVGKQPTTSAGVSLSPNPYASMLIYPLSGSAQGANILFGSSTIANISTGIGESAQNSGRLWLHGKNGIACNVGSTAIDTLFSFGFDSYNFDFNCAGISAYHYYVKAPYLNAMSKASAEFISRKDNVDAVLGLGTYETEMGVASFAVPRIQGSQKDESELVYCIDAEDLKRSFPSLVRTDNDGNAYVDYAGMVPLLLQTIQSLAHQVDELKQSLSPDNSVVKSRLNGNVDNEIMDKCYLGNNTPNPFKASTTIKYGLGTNASTACIYVYDLQGSQVGSYPLDVMCSKGELIIPGETLSPGLYLYALVVDNVEVGIKKMIVTE